MQVSFAEFGRDALPLSGGAVLGTLRENRPYAKRGKGSRSKLYIILEVIGGLRLQIAHTFSAKLRAGAEARFAGELRQRWGYAGAEKKTEATSHRRPHSCGRRVRDSWDNGVR